MTYQPIPTRRKGDRKHLTMEEWKRLFAAAKEDSPKAHVVMQLVYEAGMRAAEPGLLRIDHLKLLHETPPKVWVPRQKHGHDGYVRVTPGLREKLYAWVEAAYPDRTSRRKTDFVFPGRAYRGGRFTKGITRYWFYHLVKRLGEQAGIPADVRHPHAIRHGRVQHMLDAMAQTGKPLDHVLPLLAELVGHKTAQTTLQHYIAASAETRAVVDSVLAEALED